VHPYGAKHRDMFFHTWPEQCPVLPHNLVAATNVPRVMVSFLFFTSVMTPSRGASHGNPQQTMLSLFSQALTSRYTEFLSSGPSDATFSIKNMESSFDFVYFPIPRSRNQDPIDAIFPATLASRRLRPSVRINFAFEKTLSTLAVVAGIASMSRLILAIPGNSVS
jgi:hypothetical protein